MVTSEPSASAGTSKEKPERVGSAMSKRRALVVGATGIAGGNLAQHLASEGWDVYGLAQKPQAGPGIHAVAADLLDENSVKQAVSGLDITDGFICAWLRQ